MKDQARIVYQDPTETQETQKSSWKASLLQKVKKILPLIKTPKFLTLIVLLTTFLVILLALSLMSQKDENTQEIVVDVDSSSPSPNPSTDPSLENISARVNTYNQKLDNLQDYRETLTYPIVDLDINFEEE